MPGAASQLKREYKQGRIRLDVDLPKGEKLKGAKAELSVGENVSAKFKLKSGRNSFTYYSRPADKIALTVKGELSNALGVFEERFDIKGGANKPTDITLAFTKLPKPEKVPQAKAPAQPKAPARPKVVKTDETAAAKTQTPPKSPAVA